MQVSVFVHFTELKKCCKESGLQCTSWSAVKVASQRRLIASMIDFDESSCLEVFASKAS